MVDPFHGVAGARLIPDVALVGLDFGLTGHTVAHEPILKGEMKRASVTCSELAKRLADHGLQEREASIANKFSRGTIVAASLLAAIAAPGLTGIQLDDL